MSQGWQKRPLCYLISSAPASGTERPADANLMRGQKEKEAPLSGETLITTLSSNESAHSACQNRLSEVEATQRSPKRLCDFTELVLIGCLGGLNVVTAAPLSKWDPPQRHILSLTFDHFRVFITD